MEASPVERYVNLFLRALLRQQPQCFVVRKSVALPELLGQAPPEFVRFRNRLKLMAGLNPVTYQIPKEAKIRLTIAGGRTDSCANARTR